MKYYLNINTTGDDILIFSPSKQRYYEDFKIDRKTGESNYTRLLTDEAVSFLESQANQTAPFFLLWTPDATHAPHYASKEFLGKSRRGQSEPGIRLS